jgi:hypothetical protein
MTSISMRVLHLDLLRKYSSEFDDFFSGEQPVAIDDHGCNWILVPPGTSAVRLTDPVGEGWLLLKNAKSSYLLIEISDEKRWNTYFADDPKDVLAYLRGGQNSGRTWKEFFPLIRKAHQLAHPEPGSETRPDSGFFERLMAEVLHHADGYGYLRQKIQEIQT